MKNFNSKLDTWMFLNPMKLSLYGDWFTFFENSSWCSLGFYTFVWLIQSHELFQHVFFKTHLLEKLLSQIQQMCVLIHFLRITLIATWAFTLFYGCSISWTFSTCCLKHIYYKNLYHKSYNFTSPHFHELKQYVS